MSMPPQDLVKWCQKVKIEITEEGGISRVELWHSVEGEGGDRLATLKNLGEHTEEDLAEALWSAAEVDAKTRTINTVQRYSCMAFMEEAADDLPEQTFPFTMRGGMPNDLLGDDSEPATAAGRMKMDMRHNEALHRLLVQQSELTVGRLARDYREERNARIAAENKQLEIITLYQQLLDKKHERELEIAQQQQSAKREDQLYGMLMALAPIVLMKVVGGLNGAGGGGAPPKPGDSIPMPSFGFTDGSEATSESPLQTSDASRSVKLGRVLFSLVSNKEGAAAVLAELSQTTQIAAMQLLGSYQEFPPGADASQDAIRDVAIRELFRSMSKDEIMAVAVALEGGAQREFLELVKSYSAEEAKADAGRPEVLRNQPTNKKNGKSHGEEEDSQGQA